MIKLLYIFFILFSLITNTYSDDIDNEKKCENTLGVTEYNLLKKIVLINNYTENIENHEKIRDIIKPYFKELGFHVKEFFLENGHKLMYYSLSDNPKLWLIGHIDTVFKDVIVNQGFHCKSSEDKVFGQGVIDMKGGIVLLLSILKKIKENSKLPSSTLNDVGILINDDEEIGSPYSQNIMRNLTKNAKYAIIFEPGLSNGAFVSSSSGVKWINLHVQGIAAHAGLEHHLGLNACLELSHKIEDISKLTDYNKNLTVNVGVISGGTKPNVVCESASAQIDIRYQEINDLKNLDWDLKNIADNSYIINPITRKSTISNIKTIAGVPSLTKNKTTTFREWINNSTDMKDTKWEHVGYASDANNLSSNDSIQFLVGAGPYGSGMHTDQEYMLMKSFNSRKDIITKLILKGVSNENTK